MLMLVGELCLRARPERYAGRCRKEGGNERVLEGRAGIGIFMRMHFANGMRPEHLGSRRMKADSEILEYPIEQSSQLKGTPGKPSD